MKSWLCGVLLMASTCNRDSAVEKQRYEFMLNQYKDWSEAAQRGEEVLPGFVMIAENDCMQARRDRKKIQGAETLAKACDASLANIQAHRKR